MTKVLYNSSIKHKTRKEKRETFNNNTKKHKTQVKTLKQ